MGDTVLADTRVCRVCGEAKSLDFFAKSKSCKLGLTKTCKECTYKRAQKRYEHRKHNGLCVKCGAPSERGTVYCGKHLNVTKAQRKEIVKIRIQNNICLSCDNPSAVGSHYCEACIKSRSEKSKAQHRLFSVMVGDYYENTCYICRFKSKEFEMFDCHHLDPSKKENGISLLARRSWKSSVVPELEKCVYICSNCHRSLHHGRFDHLITSGNLVFIPGRLGALR